MKRIAKYLKGYKKEIVLAPLFKMLEATFELFVPLVVAAMIDIGIANGDKIYIIKMAILLVVLGMVGLISSVTAQYFSAKAACGFAAKLRNGLFEAIQGMSFTGIDKAGTSTLINRMTTDVNQMQTGVNLLLRLFLRSPFIVFGAMIMAFTIDVKAAFVFAVAIPALSILVFSVMLLTIPLYEKVQKQLDTLLSRTRENLTGVRVIRAFGKEQEETEEFIAQNRIYTKLQIYTGKIAAFMNPGTYVVLNIAIVVLIYIGGRQVDSGVLKQGQVVALYNYMSQILVELIKLVNLIITVTKSVACAKRAGGLFAMAEDEKEKERAQKGKIQGTAKVVFEHAALVYKNGGEEALTDIDFSVQSGETVGIIGGTGSGKSSLVHLIPNFYTATKGRVLVDGIDVADYPAAQLRDKVGIVMQKAVLFKGTIRENLLWGNKNAGDDMLMAAIEKAQAADILEKKENGLDEMVEQEGRNLSGGQRQRFSIARALVKNPEILILDDSASALDYATDAALRKALRSLENTTVFIVSQRTSSIMHADKIIVLDDGKIAGIGRHEELLRSCEVYQEIYASQFKQGEEAAG